MSLSDPIENLIEKYSDSDSNPSLELFKDDSSGDISLKTDLTNMEHVLVSAICTENDLINKDIEDFNLYSCFLNHFRRHKLSLDRKSRFEFVESSRRPTPHDLLNDASSIKNLQDSRK